MKEEVVLFGKTKSLVGIITTPASTDQAGLLPAVIILNAGLIHRIGPNRIYVKIARTLAEMGFTVFRFDFSGIGDSKAREDHLPFLKSGVDEAQEAMTYLTRTRGNQKFLLMGHCSGAGLSSIIALADTRVIGVVLMNAQGQGEEWSTYDRNRKLAKYYTNYYGRTALTDPQRWLRLIKGDIDYWSVTRNIFHSIIWNRVSTLTFRLKRVSLQKRENIAPQLIMNSDPVKDLHSLLDRGVQMLFIYSEGSSGLDFTRMLLGSEFDRLIAAKKLVLEIIPEADHLFTSLASQKDLLNVIRNWAQVLQSSYQEPISAPFNKSIS